MSILDKVKKIFNPLSKVGQYFSCDVGNKTFIGRITYVAGRASYGVQLGNEYRLMKSKNSEIIKDLDELKDIYSNSIIPNASNKLMDYIMRSTLNDIYKQDSDAAKESDFKVLDFINSNKFGILWCNGLNPNSTIVDTKVYTDNLSGLTDDLAIDGIIRVSRDSLFNQFKVYILSIDKKDLGWILICRNKDIPNIIDQINGYLAKYYQ